MAANSQQFGTRLDIPSKNVNELNISSLEQKIRKYDPYSNTYNMGWRDHPNLSYGNPQVNQPATQNHQVTSNISSHITLDNNRAKLPILALVDSRKDEQNKDLYETFRRWEVNIPLLDAIKQVSCYAKFLKELCTIKRKHKLEGCKNVRVGENVSTIIQRKFPIKCKDPGMFTIPCTLGNTKFEKAMIDLGASINVMSYSIYASLKLGPLNKIGVVIELADISKGVVEDVLVQVNDLIFPANFYVLDIEKGDQIAPILLGRPFLKTSKTKIDVHSGTLTMEFDEFFELDGKDKLEVAISKHLEKENEKLALSSDLQKIVVVLNDIPQLQ
ncbi:uncharacterized protein [Aristolochia californica]|uniref:uncharacterized protein n=1 Tax=Aristolochia californica TaxID=171875 RepID=UPI0035DD88EE